MKCRPAASVPQSQTRTSNRRSSNHYLQRSAVSESSHCRRLVSSRLWLLMCSILTCIHYPQFVSRSPLASPQSRSGFRTSSQSAPTTYPPSKSCSPSFPSSHSSKQLKIHLLLPSPKPGGFQPPHRQTSFQIFALRQNHSPREDAFFPSTHQFP